MTAPNSERGSALVFAVGIMAVLAVLALVVATIVIREKRTAASHYAYDRAFYSADAASEAGIHWIRSQLAPPAAVDSLNHVRVSAAPDTLTPDHTFEFEVQYAGKQFRPGWSTEFKDYIYRVAANGTGAANSSAALEVNATRLFREGY